jgi:hypothetical protein
MTATSVTDGSKHATAPVTIAVTASVATLNGQYGFFLASPTGNDNTSSRVGSVTLDGAGHVTGGIQDYEAGNGTVHLGDTVTGGSYTVDPTGHGTLTLTTSSGATTPLKFSFALASNSHALLIETDGNPGSGTLDLQSAGPNFAALQVSGGYSFTMTGMDPISTKKFSTGGIFTADGSSTTISSGTLDIDNGGVFSTSFFGGSFGIPDANGRGTMSWNDGASARTFVYYIITPKFLRLTETDGTAFVAGTAYAQGSVGATNAALSGNYVFQVGGWSNSGLGRTIIAGQLNADGNAHFTSGIADSVSGLGLGTAQPVSGTYSFSGSPRSTVNLGSAGIFSFDAHIYLVDPGLNVLDPNSASGGGGALLLSSSNLFVDGTGLLIPQTVTGSPTFASGAHALNLTNTVDNPTLLTEVDLAGIISSDGVGVFAGGSVDYDQDASVNSSPVLGNSFAGTFTADIAHPGRFTGTFTVPRIGVAYGYILGADTFQVSLYQISSSRAVIIVTDSFAVSQDMDCTGYLLRQVLQ